MDDPNITMEEYIRLKKEKARRRGKVYNWETATYAIVFDDAFTSEVTLSYEPTISPLNDNQLTLEYRLTNLTMKITRKIRRIYACTSHKQVGKETDLRIRERPITPYSSLWNKYSGRYKRGPLLQETTIRRIDLSQFHRNPWDQRVRSQLIGKDLVSGLLVYELPLSSLRKKDRLSLKNDMSPRDKIMNPLVLQQVDLVTLDNCVVIGKCNIRIEPIKTQKESTYKVVLDTLKLSPCYQAFLVTVDIPEIYMHQFLFTISKIKDSSSYQFKLDEKKFIIGVEVFFNHREPSLLSSTSVWGMYYKKNEDFIKLILEDFMYQIDNRQTTGVRRSNMPYPRFTKAIIQHFISKDKTISMRNNLFMHSIKNDSVLGVLKFISKYEDRKVYGKTIPDVMLSKEIMETTAYKTYLAFATRKAIHKKARKRTKVATTTMKESISLMMTILSLKTLMLLLNWPSVQVMSFEERLAADTKKAIKASKLATGPQQTTGSSEGVGLIPEVPDELKVDLAATDVSEESLGNDSDTEKSDEEEVPWIYSDDDEENKHDNDETQRDEYVHEDEYVHTDYDEGTESDNEDQAIGDAKKNDEDKAEKEKDTDQEPIQDEQAKDELAGILVSMIRKEKPKLLIFTSIQSVSPNYEITSMVDVQTQQEIPYVISAPLLDVLASVVPQTPINPTPLPFLTTSIMTTSEAPTSTSVNPKSETLYAL
ncbi:hypothetical protein Tco_0869425 [Tanacetum coccineum]